MTIQGAISELQNLLGADDIPLYYKPAIEKVIETIVDELPSADTVEVVRCKDCKHHGMDNCPVWEGHITDDYMWCYFGERSEE